MIDDATMQSAIRMLGEEQANKLLEELRQSGVSGQDFNFAFMTRLRAMQGSFGASPMMGPPPTPPLPGAPSSPTPAGAGVHIPPQPTGPKST